MEPLSQDSVSESIGHLFRHHSGRMVSVLSRLFGFEKLDMIEDAVQDALIAALKKWPFSGYPQNPQAWLIEVAKNRLLDRLRSKSSGHDTIEDIDLPDNSSTAALYFSREISEDQLRMIFACCHPAIAPDSRVALTLKIVGGFSVGEIAHAFLASEDSIAKMLTRAKQKLRAENVELVMPAPAEIPARLDAVTKVLYLMFNEGYAATGGEELVRKDLCFEAIRLCELLAAHPASATPALQALAALFLFQAARFPARSDHDGALLLLSEQDRSQWDKTSIARGIIHFQRSASGPELTVYHLEAEIAAAHALAENYAATDWRRIIDCYDALQKIKFSPVVALNRIVALGKLEGAQTALAELEKFREDVKLKNYNLYYATVAHFLAETGENARAAGAYRIAIGFTANEPVRHFLQKRIEVLRTSRETI